MKRRILICFLFTSIISAATACIPSPVDLSATATQDALKDAGTQMSMLGLDGVERLVIPGTFHSLSMDRTGNWIAAAHYQDYQDLNPMVEIYSGQTGELVLSLGPGSSPQLQP